MENVAWTLITETDGAQMLKRKEPSGKVWDVPLAPGNRHYEEYLEWLAEGNEPEVIDG